MNVTESILSPVGKICGGISLPHHKNTAEVQSIIMPPPAVVEIPLLQHIGVECEPLVKEGDKVYVGTKLGDSEKYISAPVHSSVSGTVKGFGTVMPANGRVGKTVIIESDGEMTPDPSIKAPQVTNKDELISAARECGLVGLGGAGFPTHVKLNVKEGTPIDTLIINGAECEPYITADCRECLENYDEIIEGVYLLKSIMGFEKVIICVESNKKAAIEKLYEIAADKRDTDDTVKLMELKTNYPQGAEKVIIYSATGRKMAAGRLPSDVGCVVMNITSVGALYHYIKTGMPLVTKRITVDGNAIKEPKNIIVPIGTKVSDIIEFCGGFSKEPEKILMGGPMMGTSLVSLDAVIAKPNNAILAFTNIPDVKTTACIHCGRCASHCPMGLFPMRVEAALGHHDRDRIASLNIDYCMECGICSYGCPAGRPLTQVMRLAKAEIRKGK